MEDVIGKEPTRENIPELDKALTELESMTGLQKVKDSILSFVSIARNNYARECRGESLQEVSLNRLFIGNPVTRKRDFIFKNYFPQPFHFLFFHLFCS